jgi:putative spermidine/putrescine transport system permease protein
VSGRRRRVTALLLVAPLLLFMLSCFVVPISALLKRSVEDRDGADRLPRTASALPAREWGGVPDEPVFAALAADLADTQRERTTALVAKRLNFSVPGTRSLLLKTATAVARAEGVTTWRPFFAEIDERWEDPRLWEAIARATRPYTLEYVLAALDRRYGDDGVVVAAAEPIYIDAFLRTFSIAAQVCAFCLVLGFPVAMLLAHAPERWSRAALILVLVPFWTSLLVRTTAWIVILQNEGILNKVLLSLGLLRQPAQLIFNRTGTLVAMTHVLLPFMILPIYSVLRAIPSSYLRAALSLGATPLEAFCRVYLPLAAPGISAGTLLVFILAIGYYITPALVGGTQDQMISWFVAFQTGTMLNWSLAAALASLLLIAVAMLYAVYLRLAGTESVRLG